MIGESQPPDADKDTEYGTDLAYYQILASDESIRVSINKRRKPEHPLLEVFLARGSVEKQAITSYKVENGG